jgi:hypothetical protein
MAAQIRILALIHAVIGGLALFGGLVVIAVIALPPQSEGAKATLYYVLPLYLMLSAGVFAPQFAAGAGLLARQGWARWLMVGVSAQWLFAFPLGTPLGAFGLWALLRPSASSAAPAGQAPAAQATARPLIGRDQVNLLLVIVAVGAVMALALFIGFRIDAHRPHVGGGPVYGPNGLPLPVYQPPTPAGSQSLFDLPPALRLPLALTILAVGLIVLAPGFVRAQLRRARLRRSRKEQRALRAVRVAELEADPERSAYAARIAAGEFWSNEQIDYDRDPRATVTCAHLRPIEQAMRGDGVVVRLNYTQAVHGRCRIDAAALERTGLLRLPVTYREYYETERYGDHYPLASIACAEHRAAVIRVEHPDIAKDLPVWPRG